MAKLGPSARATDRRSAKESGRIGMLRPALPLALVGGAMPVNPNWRRRLSPATIDAYALTPAVLAFIREAA
ncbi:MAG: hypothetical protein ABSF67_01090 [Roseiarcus sp.]